MKVYTFFVQKRVPAMVFDFQHNQLCFHCYYKRNFFLHVCFDYNALKIFGSNKSSGRWWLRLKKQYFEFQWLKMKPIVHKTLYLSINCTDFSIIFPPNPMIWNSWMHLFSLGVSILNDILLVYLLSKFFNHVHNFLIFTTLSLVK
jgi:hypothetical protein